jgi:uncharacterized membrane protein (DUF2068 family)
MQKSQRGSSLLILIATTKIVEAALLLAVAFGGHRLLHKDIQETLLHWARVIRVDPDNHFAHALLTRATGLSTRKLEEISLATLLYGVLFTVEGVGLLLKRRWAEYVTVISTAGFLPVEGYEVIKQAQVARFAVLTINALIVIYLILRLMRERRRKREAIVSGSQNVPA